VADGHAVEVDRLRVVRGGREALAGVSLDVRRGTVTGLLGPSGSGKSTLMRAIVGTQIVASGFVLVLGEPAGTPSLRARVAYTTQAPAVYGDLVEEMEADVPLVDRAVHAHGNVDEPERDGAGPDRPRHARA
jgi:ABC-type multidrug transport system ATPase subunit